MNIIKTNLTKQLEHNIWESTAKNGVFGCFEVTIGFGGNERVDYITYNTKGIWRCYEIKVSKADFHSKAKKTFIGHYNYYVMPEKLYKEVKNEIPNYIGVYIDGDICVKKPKKQQLQVDENILKDSMVRSLYREYEKHLKSEDEFIIDRMKKTVTYLAKEKEKYYDKYIEYSNKKFEDTCLLRFALKKLNVTKEQLVDEYCKGWE